MKKQHAIRAIFVLFALFSCAPFSRMSSAVESGSGIEGVILVGPIHGGPSRAGIPDSKPLANVAFVVTGETAPVASFTTDEQGRFRVSLPPGHYTVSIKERRSKIGYFGPFEVTVSEGKMTNVQWKCDTGMR